MNNEARIRASREELLHRTAALLPGIENRCAQTDRERRVSEQTIVEIKEAGLLNMLVPRSLGGLEMEFSLYSEIARRIATACGSTAWVFAVLAETAWVTALFPKKAQDEVWAGDSDPVTCASIVPFGKAAKVEGGYLVNGRWGYLSGSDHANWVVLSATADRDTGRGKIVDVLVRREEIEILEDWSVLGLAGTGSNGALVTDVFVPEWRAIPHAALMDGTAPGREIHPEYLLGRVPRGLVTAFSLTPVIVGLAARALELCAELLRQPAAASAPDWTAVQAKFCEATMEVEVCSMIMNTYGPRNDELLRSGYSFTAQQIMQTRLAASHMVRLARQAIEHLTSISGSKWLYNSNPLQLIFRDASAAATHRSYNWELASLAYCSSLGLGRADKVP